MNTLYDSESFAVVHMEANALPEEALADNEMPAGIMLTTGGAPCLRWNATGLKSSTNARGKRCIWTARGPNCSSNTSRPGG
jgi:hypothetical protein